MARRFGVSGSKKPISDDEFVNNIRKKVKNHDRSKNAMIALAILVALSALAVVGALSWIIGRFMLLAPGNNAGNFALGQIGLVTGLFLGVGFGHTIHSSFHGLLGHLLNDYRMERLIIRYHDALMSLKNNDVGSPGADAENLAV